MKYSVIVPVYNVSRFLPKCIESILACNCDNFELLLIDDGSIDGSIDICNSYLEKDSRVRVFHKENGGVSSARNLGLDNALGEWVMFVDADDWVSNSFFDIEDSNSEVIERSYYCVDENGGIISETFINQPSVLNKTYDIYKYFVNRRCNALWNKVIKRSVIGNIRFDKSVSIGEDFLFYLEIIKRTTAYEFQRKGEYFYFVRSGSAMTSIKKNERIKVLFDNMSKIKKITESESLKSLQNGILMVTYFPSLCLFRKDMNKQELVSFKRWVKYLISGSMDYVPLKLRFRLFIYDKIIL